MVQGFVKWFDNRKGFGFLVSDACPGDIFVHYSNLEQEGFRSLKDGEAVEFELVEGEKGPYAVQVRTIDRKERYEVTV